MGWFEKLLIPCYFHTHTLEFIQNGEKKITKENILCLESLQAESL